MDHPCCSHKNVPHECTNTPQRAWYDTHRKKRLQARFSLTLSDDQSHYPRTINHRSHGTVPIYRLVLLVLVVVLLGELLVLDELGVHALGGREAVVLRLLDAVPARESKVEVAMEYVMNKER